MLSKIYDQLTIGSILFVTLVLPTMIERWL
jgi:hypothetical protein